MANRIRKERRKFMNSDVLKVIGVMMTVQACLGMSLLERNVLDLSAITPEIAQEMVEGGGGAMVALAYIFRMGASIAWPLFAFLAVQGFQYTGNLPRYLLRMGLFAVLCEVPYNLVYSGSFFDFSGQNVLFSYFFGLIMLMLSDAFYQKKKNIFPALGILTGCLFWAVLLRCEYSMFILPAMFAFYYLEDKELLRDGVIVGVSLVLGLSSGFTGIAAALCVAFSLVLLHWYNDQDPHVSKWVWYGIYFLQLLILGLMSYYL